MKQTKWLKKVSYTVAALGVLSVAQAAVSSPILYDGIGKVKAGQNARAAEAAPNNKLRANANNAKSTQDFLNGMDLDVTQVKLADGRIRVTVVANNPKMPMPPTPMEYYWITPSNSEDHQPESELTESSTFTFTMPAAQTEKYIIDLMGIEMGSSNIAGHVSTSVVPIESTQAYLNGLKLDFTQSKLANGAIRVVVKTSNPNVQTSPKPVEFHWGAPYDSVNHEPASEYEQSKSSTFAFTMPAAHTENYNLGVTGMEKGNTNVSATVNASVVPLGSTQAYLNALELNITQSKLANGEIQVVAKTSNPTVPTSPKLMDYAWIPPSNSVDHHPESELEQLESSTFTFTMPAAQTEKYDLSMMVAERAHTTVHAFIHASIQPLKAHQAFLNRLQPGDTQSNLKGSRTAPSSQSITGFVNGLKLDVTQDKLASGETRVVVKAINRDAPTPPTPLTYGWRGPTGSTEHHPANGKRSELTTFAYTMPAAQTENYYLYVPTYDKVNNKLIRILETRITPAESTQAFLNGLTLETTQTKLEVGGTKVVVKAINTHMSASPTPVEYYWIAPPGSTEHHPKSGSRTKFSTFEFTMPATQIEEYNFNIEGFEEGNNKVRAPHMTSIMPIGTTQAFLNGLTFHSTQTRLESGATRVVVQASNPHEATPPMPIEYRWGRPVRSTEHNPTERLTDSSTFEFTMPAGQVEEYSIIVKGYQKDTHTISSSTTVSFQPIKDEINPF
ncbi:hypothetical protein QN379_05595 [Glaciimonas sp. Gout2]|uniref:hypothetical protein n=1 Tax=unclassified Glaciimonas TaxID=2644401 RepID=UPI002B23EA71|nr:MULTISPECIES: hypothetical protein [unclassified Glaciimonas]MEB0011486.1 hypothetical protein [Glaciimonas sp. Cout2]MEB0081490.1 hypothetical protein [Glaciimonas sp. Gout2]